KCKGARGAAAARAEGGDGGRGAGGGGRCAGGGGGGGSKGGEADAAPSAEAGGTPVLATASGAAMPQAVANEAPLPEQQAHAMTAAIPAAAIEVGSFRDILELCSSRRDARLRVHLEEHVSLVSFAVGHVEIFPLPGAPKGLAGELGGKLSDWTGARWVVSVGREAVEPTIGEVLRAERAAKIEQAKQDPAIVSLLKAFPDAEVVDVRAAQTETVVGHNDDGNDQEDT
ncbi:MAG: hypothetical protein JXQ99_22010, partial [Hyphomicrobiaceae bacterium]